MMRLIIFLTLVIMLLAFKEQAVYPVKYNSTVQQKALLVLEQKCNACHLQKHKSVVFTLENMNTKGKEINYQVFIKERMPKGKVKLNEDEKSILRKWLVSIGCHNSL